jgi:hypothetical protein
LGPTLRADLPFMVKGHALFDQLNAAVVPGVFMLAFAAPAFVMLAQQNPWMNAPAKWFILSQINVLLLPAYAWIALRSYATAAGARLRELLRTMPVLVLLFLGMNFSLTVALIEGLIDRKAEFRRTAKYRVDAKSAASAWKGTAYAPRRDLAVTWGSTVLAVVFAGYLVFDLAVGSWSLIVFHGTMALSNAVVGARAWRRA